MMGPTKVLLDLKTGERIDNDAILMTYAAAIGLLLIMAGFVVGFVVGQFA